MQASGAGDQQGRILVVDDDPALGKYLCRVLNAGGFAVVHELDANSALDRVRDQQWDLLITDIELPGMSGLELLDRARETAPELPVAVITGHPTVDCPARPARSAACSPRSARRHPTSSTPAAGHDGATATGNARGCHYRRQDKQDR